MKKTLLSIFSIVTLVMGVSSCNKDAKEENIGFTASMEACVDQESKTVLDGVHVNWVANDQIIIYGSEGSGIFTAVPHTDNPTIADLTNGTANPGSAKYYAFYPVEIARGNHQFIMNAVQTSEDGSLTEFPMYAESDERNIAFKNIFGALKINLQSANLPAVKAIEITVSEDIRNKDLNGDYTIRQYGVSPTIRLDANGSKTTRLEMTTAQDITNGHDFYIAMPHGSYVGLQIRVYDEMDNLIATKTLKADRSLYIGRSQVTNINLSL